MVIGLLAGVAACGSSDDDDDDSSNTAGGGAAGGGAGAEAGKGGGGDAGSSGGAAGAGSGGGSAAGSGGKSGPRMAYPSGLVGNFNLKLTPKKEPTPLDTNGMEASTSVLGILTGAPQPKRTKLVMTAEDGDCQLYEPEVPSCEMNCTLMDAVCTEDDVCTPNPTAYGVGLVHLTAGSSKADLEYIAKNYQLKAGDKLAFPPCKEGDEIKVEAEGGDYEPFSITSKCIDELDADESFAIEAGKPMALTWSKPGNETLARMQVRLDISHHGGFKGEIQCEVADSGSFSIPAALLDKLLDLGIAGFPTVQLTRIATGKPSGQPSGVTFTMTMYAERDVTIPGLTSCASDNSQCPMGQTCQSDLTCK